MARYLTVLVVLCEVLCSIRPAWAIIRTWDDGAAGDNWTQGDNWSPNGVPESGDTAVIGPNPNAVDDTVVFGVFPPFTDTVSGLLLSSGADLDLNGGRIVVNGPTTVGSVVAGTTLCELLVSPVEGMNVDAMDTDTLTIGDAARLTMSGGSVSVDGSGAVDGVLAIEPGGAIFGYGAINLDDINEPHETYLMFNDGTITVGTPFPTVIGEPTARTLSINAPNDTELVQFWADLDGSDDDGQLIVTRNATLELNVREGAAFTGDIQLFGNSTLSLGFDFVLDADGDDTAELDIDSGTTGGFANLPAVPAVIQGANFTLAGGARISLGQDDEVLRIESQFAALGGTFDNAGTIHFAGDAGIGNSAVFNTMGTGRIVNDAGNNLTLGVGLDADTPLTNDGLLEISGDVIAGTARIDSFIQSPTGTLDIKLGDVIPGDFDALIVDGNAQLAGTLDVTLIDNFEPIFGNSFVVIESTFGNITGEFNVENMPVFNDLTLQAIYNPTSVVLEVVPVGLPGDYNQNGTVDAADYTVWRDNRERHRAAQRRHARRRTGRLYPLAHPIPPVARRCDSYK